MILNDPSTISRWLSSDDGPISLRHAPDRRRDPQAGAGILTSAAIGTAIAAWVWAAIQWFAR